MICKHKFGSIHVVGGNKIIEKNTQNKQNQGSSRMQNSGNDVSMLNFRESKTCPRQIVSNFSKFWLYWTSSPQRNNGWRRSSKLCDSFAQSIPISWKCCQYSASVAALISGNAWCRFSQGNSSCGSITGNFLPGAIHPNPSMHFQGVNLQWCTQVFINNWRPYVLRLIPNIYMFLRMIISIFEPSHLDSVPLTPRSFWTGTSTMWSGTCSAHVITCRPTRPYQCFS